MHLIFLDESGSRKIGRSRSAALLSGSIAGVSSVMVGKLHFGAANGPPDKEAKWHGIKNGEVRPKLADQRSGHCRHPPLRSSC